MNIRKTLLTHAKIVSAGSMMALCIGASAVLVPLTATAQNFESTTQRQMLDSVAAVVNDGVIMRSELDERIAQVEQQAQAQGGSLPPRSQLVEQVLERMIMDEIQLQMASQANLSVDDTELNRQLRSIAESNNMSLDAFADAVEADGMSLAEVRDDIRREMLMRQVQQRQVSQRVSVSERDVERFLNQQPSQQGQSFIEETRARHLLVELTPTRNENQARARAEQARQRLQQGADFAAVAREFSDDRGSAMNGGELGWVRPGQTVPAFEEAMNSLGPEQLSQPVRSQFGYHVIEVLERRRQDVTEESRREQVRQAIFQRRANEELQTWQREAREQAFVDIRL